MKFGLIEGMAIYYEGKDLLGIGSVKLPDVGFTEETFNNSGTGGEVNIVSGRLEPMTAQVMFEQFFSEQYGLMKANAIITLEIITIMPDVNPIDGDNDVVPMRYVLKGQFKRVENNEQTFSGKVEATFNMNVQYYRVEQDGTELLEVNPLDPQNPYKVNGVPFTVGDALRAIF